MNDVHLIIGRREMTGRKSEVGPKALNLGRLGEAGFSVPDFVVIPPEALRSRSMDAAAREILRVFPRKRYAVRSAAFAEDERRESHAGEFLTKLDVEPAGLRPAMEECILRAKERLSGDLGKFSLMIQEFVPADYVGVTFTRNPSGGRDMAVEYARAGLSVVGGEVRPSRLNFHWYEPRVPEILPGFEKAVESFRRIESLFAYPQDIEWCIRGGKWYFLQSRPITTITEDAHRGYRYLDSILPKYRDFIFEKTEISEIVPRPTPSTRGLLDLIYGKDGPVRRAYSKYGVRFTPKDFFRIVGNELYVDREEEIAAILPSYSYLTGSRSFRPRFWRLAGMCPTLRNLWALARIEPRDPERFRRIIVERTLSSKAGVETLESALRNFMADYELVFEANLLAARAIYRLERFIGSRRLSFGILDALSLQVSGAGPAMPEELRALQKKWIGNSLELFDTTPFSSYELQPPISDAGRTSGIASEERHILVPLAQNARAFIEARKYAHWLAIKNVNDVRDAILRIAARVSADRTLIYFATVEELLAGNFREKTLLERKEEYEKYGAWTFPPRLMGAYPKAAVTGPIGVSHGKAKGMLVSESDVAKKVPEGKILYSDLLSPNLAKYFGQVSGIVSERGGILSHLAILARERGIPVITNFDLKDSGIALGDVVSMDGSSGRVSRAS